MGTTNEGTQSRVSAVRLPLWLQLAGGVIVVGSAILEARLIWEQTVWTWELGPQIVGFSLAHGSAAVLLVFPLLLVLWTAAVMVFTAWNFIRKRHVAAATWIEFGLAILLLVLVALPSGFWQRAFIGRMAASPRSGDLLVYAACGGDLGTVRALVSHGVRVDATDRSDWRTALHAAALKGDLQSLRYLVSKGANINALDRSGDSPLELAASRSHDQAAQFLKDHGAIRIRGSDEQHQKALDDMVHDDIERTESPEVKKALDDIEIKKREQENPGTTLEKNTP